MYSYGTNVLFLCRLCKDSFQLIDDFIKHKKVEHSVEFRTSNCIVFEDILILNTCNDEEKNCGNSMVKEEGNPVPSLNVPLAGIENNLTEVDLSHSHQPIPHDLADAFDPFPVSMPDYQNYDNPENFSYQDDDETSDNSLQPNHDDYNAFDLPQASADVSFNFVEPKMELKDFENDQKINTTAINVTTQGLQNPNVLLKKLSSMEIQNYSRLQNQQETVQAAAEVISESQCKLCPKKFNSAAELEIHGRVCILDNNKQDRYCFICEKLFSSKRRQNVHTIKHHETEDQQWELRIFKCNQCSSSFFTEHELRRHQGSHALARPFQCTEPGCGKAFKRVSYLRKHLKYLHSSILELFKCPEPNCTSTSAFRRKEDLVRHLRMCHKTKPIP